MAEYYFNLPQITQLTIPQQGALNETNPIALSGGPGTGKSVVSLWRHIRNYQNNNKSLLLTYTTTLKEYFYACCKGQNEKAANAVKTSLRGKPNSKDWNEIIVDEAQDLPNSYYYDIKNLSKVSYGADDTQILYNDQCSTERELQNIFMDNIECVLDRNFRNTQRIMIFVKQAFHDAYIPQSIIDSLANNVGVLPVLLITNESKYEKTNDKQNNSIINIINQLSSDTHNIAILVPWDRDVEVFKEVLKDKGIDYSSYSSKNYEQTGGCGHIKNIHITTFKSAKGLEFDTVIIPKFNRYNEIFDSKFHLTWHDFYVGCTRARSNLYLIGDCDIPELNNVTDKQIL